MSVLVSVGPSSEAVLLSSPSAAHHSFLRGHYYAPWFCTLKSSLGLFLVTHQLQVFGV